MDYFFIKDNAKTGMNKINAGLERQKKITSVFSK